MGIPSLNSAILYNVSLYFLFTDPSLPLRMTPKSCKYNKYPEPIHRNRHFHGQKAHFDVRIHENRHFHGQETTIQSGLIREQLNCVKAVG